MDSQKKFLLASLGILVFYFYFGIAQEKITKGTYTTEDGETEKFTYAMSLVFFVSLTNYLFAKLLVTTVMPQGEDSTKAIYYGINALTYVLGMVCSNMALQFVSYPTQVVAKSGKPIPVMILGVLIGRKSYPLRKYFFVLLVVIGVALFMFKDKKTSADSASAGIIGFGELLLILSLLMDGLTGAVQELMRGEHQPKPLHIMVQSSFYSSVYLLFGILISGEIFNFIPFVQRHPFVMWHLLSFSVAGSLGQYCIYCLVSDFGALPVSIVTTTRKFFTVLSSVIFFGNVLLTRQWIATILVFTGLFLDILYGKNTAKMR